MIKSGQMQRKGFSIMELVVVLAIVGILGIFAFLALDPYKGIKLDAGAQKVAADLQYARNLALSTAKWVGVSFEVDPVNTYRVFEADDTGDTIIENPSALGKPFVVDIEDFYDGIIITQVNCGGGSKMVFHPLGIPYTDRNGSQIAGASVITLSYRGVTREVRVTPNTGRIEVQ